MQKIKYVSYAFFIEQGAINPFLAVILDDKGNFLLSNFSTG